MKTMEVPIGGGCSPCAVATVDVARYARASTFTSIEYKVLGGLIARQESRPAGGSGRWTADERLTLRPLVLPVDDVLDAIGASPTRWSLRFAVIHRCVHAMFRLQAPALAWSREQWLEVLHDTDADIRTQCMAVAYLLGGYRDLHFHFPKMNRWRFASRLLGSEALNASLLRLQAVLTGWGYAADARWYVREAMCDMALAVGSAQLEQIAVAFDATDLERESSPRIARAGHLVLRILATLGLCDLTAPDESGGGWVKGIATATDVLPEWIEWSRRWFDTSTLSRRTREDYLGALLKAGRWMTVRHPDAASPAAWTRPLAAEYVAAVDRMTLGEWSRMPRTRRYVEAVGLPLDPCTKAGHLGAVRAFFRDAQEWGWIAGRFDAGASSARRERYRLSSARSHASSRMTSGQSFSGPDSTLRPLIFPVMVGAAARRGIPSNW